MRFDLAMIDTLFHTEMRLVLRDRRSVIASIVLPLLVMPLMLFATNWTTRKREQKLQEMACRYAVTGSQAAAARALAAATRERLAADQREKNGDGLKLEEVPSSDPAAALSKGEIHVILEGWTAEEARRHKEQAGGGDRKSPPGKVAAQRAEVDDDGEEEAQNGAWVMRLAFRADRDESKSGTRRLHSALLDTRRAQQAGLLKARGFPLQLAEVAAISEVNIASKGQVAGLALGRIITPLLLLFILTGGALVATDSLAGEKERGTLETLLTTAASRLEIVVAKYLAILAVAVVITLIQGLNLLVYVGFKLIPVPADFAAAIPPSTAILLLVLFLPVAALAAGVLLLTSGYARSYREAQLYFFPVLLLGMVPALAPLLPGLPLRSVVALVPVANLALAAREILIGSFDWPMIAVSWLVSAAAAVWTLRVAVRFLSEERLITAVEADAIEYAGGPALFERHVLRWYALLWAGLLIVNNYTATFDLRVQITINLVGLFLGASLLMIRRYRLEPRMALALRAPKPMVWVGVLFAVPGGLLTGLGLFRLANLVVPVPQRMMESFSESVVPEGIPFGQLLFFLTVLPGIFEEMAFRGVLLHGLHRRLHPAVLALVVGLVFGVFHVTLFRFVPTAWLGVLLAMVTLLTGSIFPAMVWHALSNAVGILAYRHQVPLAELDLMSYAAGAVILAAALWILWRHRTPYPGLRPWR